MRALTPPLSFTDEPQTSGYPCPLLKKFLEPNLLIPKKKPIGNVEIDKKHQLAKYITPKNVVWCGSRPHKTIGLNTNTTLQNTGSSFERNVFICGLSGSALELPDNNALDGATEASWLIDFHYTSGTVIFSKWNTGSNKNFSILNYNGKFCIELSDGTNTFGKKATTTLPVNNTDYTIVIRWWATGNLTIHINGINQEIIDWSNGVVNQLGVTTDTYMMLAKKADAWPSGLGAYGLALALDKKIPEELAMDLSINPYQFLKPALPDLRLLYNIGGNPSVGVTIPDPRWEEPNLLIAGKKPIGEVEIDWDNKAANGLDYSYLFNNRSVKNLADKNSDGIPTSGVSFEAIDGRGLCAKFDTDSEHIAFEPFVISETATIIFVVYIDEFPDGVGSWLSNVFGDEYTTASWNSTLIIRLGQGGSSSYKKWGMMSRNSSTGEENILATRELTLGYNFLAVKLDGVNSKIFDNQGITGTGTLTDRIVHAIPNEFWLGGMNNASDNYRQFMGSCFAMNIYPNVALPDETILSMLNNSYQFLIPKV